MGQFVLPRVYLVGQTEMDAESVMEYLSDTDQTEFWDDAKRSHEEGGLSWGEVIISLFAKLCYKSLKVGKNANVTRVRTVKSNIQNCFDTGHGSVFEHFNLNFLITDCSRVFTHELVRHRAGTAFSQTSGRYCRLDNIDLVWDPILDPVKDIFEECIGVTERAVYLAECRLGLRKPPPLETVDGPATHALIASDPTYGLKDSQYMWVPDDSFDFEKRKKLTSAIRRIAPNGQSNEIGFSCNIRALRHILQLRTARHAEWEVRYVFNQVFSLIKEKFPLMVYRAKTRMVDGLLEVYGMKGNPYEIDPRDPAGLEQYETLTLTNELARRRTQ